MCKIPLIKLGSHFLHSFASFQVRCYPAATLTLTMSWKKDSACVGLAGLMPAEAAKEALLCEEFQNMPDPLDVKKEDLFLLVCTVLFNLCCVCCVS